MKYFMLGTVVAYAVILLYSIIITIATRDEEENSIIEKHLRSLCIMFAFYATLITFFTTILY